MTSEIIVITTQACPACKMTRRWLNTRGIDYTHLDATACPDIIEAAKAQGHMRAPLVWDNTHQRVIASGFNPDKLKNLLNDTPTVMATQTWDPTIGWEPEETSQEATA